MGRAPRYRYAVREVRVANGMLTVGLTTFALNNVMRVEVVGVARPQPIGPWVNQVAYPFAILAAVMLLLGLVGMDVAWEAAVAMACAASCSHSAASLAIDALADDRDRLLIDAGGVPPLNGDEVRLPGLVACAADPAVTFQEIGGGSERVGL